MEQYNLHQNIRISCVTSPPKHHFFGFYDVCPWDVSGRYILAHEVDFIDRMPNENDMLRVGYIDTQDGNSWHEIGKTTAWNFQQGARLQWIPNNPTKVVYNVREKDRLASVLYDIDTKEKKELPWPIYALSPDGVHALTLNFARLENNGGYGYAGLKDKYENELFPKDDGIFRMNLKTGENELIVSLAKLVEFKSGVPVNKSQHHYVTHALSNPKGTRFGFLHRHKLDDGGRSTRLFTADPDGSNLFCLAEGDVSHFDWFDDEHIFIWGRYRPLLAKMRQRNVFSHPILKPILKFLRSKQKGFVRNTILGDKLLLFTDKRAGADVIGGGVIVEDGHFTRLNESRWILGDTYVNKDMMIELFLYDLEEKKKVALGEFYALPDAVHNTIGDKWATSGMRSDLHPRWSRDGARVCIDSVHEGTRQMYVVDVKDVLGSSTPEISEKS